MSGLGCRATRWAKLPGIRARLEAVVGNISALQGDDGFGMAYNDFDICYILDYFSLRHGVALRCTTPARGPH